MCDRINENQDPLQKISRQLSELASAQQSGHLVPEIDVEESQWTQFSGITPSHTGSAASLPNFYPWNSISGNSNTDTLIRDGDHNAIYGHNNSVSVRNISPVQDGSNQGIHFPWQREGVSSPHQAFRASDDFRGGYSDARSTGSLYHQQESHRLGPFDTTDSVFQYSGEYSPLDRFGFSGNILSHPSENYISSGYDNLHQTQQFMNLTPSSHFSHATYNVSESISSRNQSPGQLEEVSQTFLPHDRSADLRPHLSSFDNSASSFTFPNTDYSLGARSLSLDPSIHDVVYHQTEQRSSVDLDLGFNIEKQSSVKESEKSPAIDSQRIYTEALNEWLAFDSSSVNPSLGTDLKDITQTVSEPSSPDLLKPSYSDIAKTPKSNQPTVQKQDQSVWENIQKNQPSHVPRKDTKASRPHVRRTFSSSKFWPRGSLGSDVDQPKMPTNSRYGLDSFEDKLSNPGSSPTKSSETLPSLGKRRKASDSSLGCGSLTLNDIISGMSEQQIDSGGDASSQVIGNEKEKEKITPAKSSGRSPSPISASRKQDKKEETLFFDPRRIFQTKSSTEKSRTHSQSSSAPTRVSFKGTIEQEHTVLNNGKPTTSAYFSKLPTTARKHDYINNDLRDSSKLTNQAAAAEAEEVYFSPSSNQHDSLNRQSKDFKSGAGKRFSGRSNGSSSHRERKKGHDKRQQPDGSANFEYNTNRGVFWSHVDLVKIEEWCCRASEKLRICCSLLFTALFTICIYAFGCILYVSSAVIHFICIYVGKCWRWLKGRVFGYSGMGGNGTDWPSQDFFTRKVGLEENIVLPSTGDEAMKRLLSCKGKDPYSILGVRADSSDEDIKKYYRKQAFLVHPDKNQEPGAEEAFKVLGHAIEMIGDPTRRKEYDSHTQEEIDADGMKAFAEMLSRLQTKIQEAANNMPCDNCVGKHRRFPVDRPCYHARYCERCNTRHAAKEGDVWAESAMLGFLWHYYAVMEGHVYEITEWMKCHQEYFKHMKANDHGVVTRIAKGANKKPREPNMEEIINRMFKATDAMANRQSTGAEPGWGHASSGSSAAPASSANNKKSGRRNKKKRM